MCEFNSGRFGSALGITLLVCLLKGPVRAQDEDRPAPGPLQLALLDDRAQDRAERNEVSVSGYGVSASRHEIWQAEHDEISQIRRNRHEPTTRGLWYSYRSREAVFGRQASDAQYPIILAQGLMMAAQGQQGREAAEAGFKSVFVTGLITMAVKKTWRRRRPYPNDEKFGTFPSGHTSTSFAMAGVFGAAVPQYKWMAYTSAATIGWARVKVRAHYWHDVLAGAALGLTVANQFKPSHALGGGPLANVSVKF